MFILFAGEEEGEKERVAESDVARNGKKMGEREEEKKEMGRNRKEKKKERKKKRGGVGVRMTVAMGLPRTWKRKREMRGENIFSKKFTSFKPD